MNKFRITPLNGVQYILETELGLNQVEASLSPTTDVQPIPNVVEEPAVEVMSKSVKKRKEVSTDE